MKIQELFDLQKLFEKLKKRFMRRRALRSRTMIQANRDWKFTLFFFMALNIVSILFGMYLFFEINRGDIFLADPPPPSASETLDREQLQRTLVSYEKKTQRFEQLKRQKPILVDPSL